MNRKVIKQLISDLRETLNELESEIISDPSAYTSNTKYEDVLEYYQVNDDDGDAI